MNTLISALLTLAVFAVLTAVSIGIISLTPDIVSDGFAFPAVLFGLSGGIAVRFFFHIKR